MNSPKRPVGTSTGADFRGRTAIVYNEYYGLRNSFGKDDAPMQPQTGTGPPLFTPRGWRSLQTVTRRLIGTRFFRSIAQGALAVDFTLYLHARHWSAAEIGLLLMSGGLANAALSLLVGVVSDRFGRKRFLLVYEAGMAVGTALILLFPAPWILAVCSSLFGFGRGANGASGPFAPAEQAWLAQTLEDRQRPRVFSFNAAVQFWGMGIGSLLAALLPHMLPGATGASAYAPMFGLALLVAASNFFQIQKIDEQRPGFAAAGKAQKTDANRPGDNGRDSEEERLVGRRLEQDTRKRENRALTLLTVVNAVNSLGIGLVAPLMPYWFNLRFGAGPELIGPVYSLTFLVTGVSSLVIGRIAQTQGLVRSIVLPRLLGVALLIAMPFVPTFSLAATLYVIRSIVNRGSVGARQAFSVGLVRDKRRGLASGLNSVSWTIPSSLGPAVGGSLIAFGSLVWPFALASGLQLAYIVLFATLLGRYDVRPAKSRPSPSS